MPMRAGNAARPAPAARESFRRGAVLASAALAALACSSCAPVGRGILVPNLRPTVELTAAPAVRDSTAPYFYAYRMDWSGNDTDGRIDHFEYCIDPTSADSVWIRTTKNEQIVFFRASHPDPVRDREQPTASDPHVFVIKAVDDRGGESARRNRAFFAFTIAPTVAILDPPPSSILPAFVPPSIRIEWTGSDPDGQFTQKPVQYKFKLFSLDSDAVRYFLAHPDSLRRREAAQAFAGWDSTSADTQFAQFTNLTPQHSYLFVVIGFDEAGAYSPVFSLDSNMLQFSVGLAASLGPRIHIFNAYVDFTYDSGGYSTDPLRWIPIEVPAHRPIPVNWDAIPPRGSRIQAFRWMVDGNVNDNTPRSDELHDYVHWTQPDPTMPNAVILHPATVTSAGGFEPGLHLFYLECADNNGLKSLGILAIKAVTPSFDRNLLVVNDTRLEPDKFPVRNPPPGVCPIPYTLPWPSYAELDTFLFAHGGVPWRCTLDPSGAVASLPGVLAGYEYDTLCTRLDLENPANGAPLAKIGQYRNLIWIVDDVGAQSPDRDPDVFPETALRSMSGPGKGSSLEAYVQLGGRVWLMGGGAAYASLENFNRPSNDFGQKTFTNAQGELVPGRIMYDGAHWQSAIAVTSGLTQTSRYEHTFQVLAPGGVRDTTIIVAAPWSHSSPYLGTLRSPDYAKLPAEMRLKSPETDAIPPTRSADQPGQFYRSSLPCEYILQNNPVFEDTDPDPDIDHQQVVLDTLMQARGGLLLTSPGRDGIKRAPTMTYYHGSQANQFVFSGFAPWCYARQDCTDLFDFVLQDLWHLPRHPIDRGSAVPSARSRGTALPRLVTPRNTTAAHDRQSHVYP